MTGWKSFIKEALKQGGIEASEEMLTECANIISDAMVMGERSGLSASIKKYQEQGMTENKAVLQACLDSIGQVTLAGAGGFISGVGMGGGKLGIEQGSQAIYDHITKRHGETAQFGAQQADGVRFDTRTGVDTPAAQTAVEGLETTSTAIDADPATHTPEQMAVIEAYQADTDETLKEVFQGYLDNPNQGFSRHNISSVSQRQAQDAERLLGGTYDGYRNAINASGILHILVEHGPDGVVDHSLSDLNDIARMGYVLDNL